jgi:steroid 5-alpha reductase family enzyme
MMALLETYIFLFVVTIFSSAFWFCLSLLRKRNDVADVAWGIGFLLAAWISWIINVPDFDRGFFVTILVTIWSLRLSIHIYLRNRGKDEDYRYKAWRESWGKWFYIRSFFQVFLFQGFLMLLVVSPVVFINVYRGGTISFFDISGGLIWLIGFIFEFVGDRQLAQFIRRPENAGHLMRSGLWQYTRHPNYFGEVTQWWGLFVIAFSVPYGFISCVGPLTITFLITKVSGIPLLEKKMAGNPEFESYKKQTSIFFPLPKKY